MQNTILGLDIGTGSTKAVLHDLSGRELATAQADYPLLTPQPGWVEQDPEIIWRALVEVLQAVVSQTGPDCHIRAVEPGPMQPSRGHAGSAFERAAVRDNCRPYHT